MPTLSRDGYLVARRVGVDQRFATDLYHFLVCGSWARLILGISIFYLFAITVFALGFYAVEGSVAGGRPGVFSDSFFLSVQTFSTIGYGDLGPGNGYANVLVTAEMLAGLLTTAIATGLVFAKFARPTARLLFSRVAVIQRGPHDPELSFRVANQRSNRIIDADIRVALSRLEETRDGGVRRRLIDVPLERSRAPFLALTWTARHVVTQKSPLYGQTRDTLRAQDALLTVSVVGTDETLAAAVHAQHVYRADDIIWNARFRDVFRNDQAGQPVVDYSRFHEFEALGETS